MRLLLRRWRRGVLWVQRLTKSAPVVVLYEWLQNYSALSCAHLRLLCQVRQLRFLGRLLKNGTVKPHEAQFIETRVRNNLGVLKPELAACEITRDRFIYSFELIYPDALASTKLNSTRIIVATLI